MNITHERKEIGLFVTKNRFVTILEQVARPTVAAVEILCIPRQQFPHRRCDTSLPASKQKMCMVFHERPSTHVIVAFTNDPCKAVQKSHPVVTVDKYGGLINPPHHYVVQGTGNIEAGLARHDATLVLFESGVKRVLQFQ